MKYRLAERTFFIVISVVLIVNGFHQDSRIHELEASNRENLKLAQREHDERVKAERMRKAFHDLSETYRLDNNDLRTEIATLKKERDDAQRASRSRRVADVVVRTTDRSMASGSGNSIRPTSLGKKEITGYCATGNRTASGKVPRPGMVATLDRRIKFGTRVRIDGVGTFVVEDRIGHSSEFDIFFGSCAEARQFGRRYLRVEIL